MAEQTCTETEYIYPYESEVTRDETGELSATHDQEEAEGMIHIEEGNWSFRMDLFPWLKR